MGKAQDMRTLPLEENTDDFVFDNEMLAQALFFGRIGELSCPTRYMDEASSINFARSVKYGIGAVAVTLKCVMARLGLRSAVQAGWSLPKHGLSC